MKIKVLLLLITIHYSFYSQKCNKCNLDLLITVNKFDSILLFPQDLRKTNYLTQNKYDSIHIYTTIKGSKNNKMEIASFNAVITYSKDEIDEFNQTKLNTFSDLYSNSYIDLKYVTTTLSEWTFVKDRTPDERINKLYLYVQPSTTSKKTKLEAWDWLIFTNNSVIFAYNIEIMNCKGRWAKIKLTTKESNFIGWMPWYNLCHRTLSLCHHLPEDGVQNEK